MSSPSLVFRRLSADSAHDLSLLQDVLGSAPAYWRLIENRDPGQTAAADTFCALPPGKSESDKFVLGVFLRDAMIGCADLVRGYPNPETAMLGLLLISETHQRAGLGRASLLEIERFLGAWQEIRKLRIGVIRVNSRARRFWQSQSFSETGAKHPYESNGVTSETLVLEKPIS